MIPRRLAHQTLVIAFSTINETIYSIVKESCCLLRLHIALKADINADVNVRTESVHIFTCRIQQYTVRYPVHMNDLVHLRPLLHC